MERKKIFIIIIVLIFTMTISVTSVKANTRLKKRIEKILTTPSNIKCEWSISAYDLSQRKTVVKIHERRWRMPASILKIITAWTALKSLGADFTFITDVETNGSLVDDGILKGDLIVRGRGDPSWSFRFYDDDFEKGPESFIDQLLKKVKLKTIDGNIVCDDTYFLYKPYGPSWSWEVFQWGYGAKVSALSMDDNLMMLKIYPTKDGSLVRAESIPPFFQSSIHNETFTSSSAVIDDLVAYKPFDSNQFFISGLFPTKVSSWSLKIAVSDPAEYFGRWVKYLLQKKGVKVRGDVKVIHRLHYIKTPSLEGKTLHLASIKGFPLKVLLKQMMKKSVNLYAELVLRTMGKKAFPFMSDERISGIKHVYATLHGILEEDKNIHMCDGSGLSRRNLLNTKMMVQLLAQIYASPQYELFKGLLPVSGIDGTLKGELNSYCKGRVFAKTGQIEQVNSMAGFIHTKRRHWLAFCIVVNNHPSHKWKARQTIASIVRILCQY